MGPDSEGKVHSVVFDNGIVGHVIGTVVTFTGLPGAVAISSLQTDASTTDSSSTIQYARAVQPQAAHADGSIVHVVQSGDTAFTIAVAYGVSLNWIIERNLLGREGNYIFPGQLLVIRDAS